MNVFKDYGMAHLFAQKKANETGLDVGIERMREYGSDVFIVRFLPRESKSFGCDARAERVKPEKS